MDIFTLTQTPFIKKLLGGVNDDLQIDYKDFVLQVFDICSNRNNKGYAFGALLVVEIEISHLQSEAQRNAINQSLTAFITKAPAFIRQTMSHLEDMGVQPAKEEELIKNVGLKWSHKKVALVEIAYAFHVAKCFGDESTVKDIVMEMARAFNVEISENYIYKKFNEIKVRTLESRTYFIDSLGKKLSAHMCELDAQN